LYKKKKNAVSGPLPEKIRSIHGSRDIDFGVLLSRTRPRIEWSKEPREAVLMEQKRKVEKDTSERRELD
jgi:hypothetical protein